ncbi:erythromycin esterase family protein [Dyadobacter sp. CY261]|uniref:erythromycin esterase family protein n=1 Tax=Dyadobacter sp. CY261 TaxID=2907203 RepID=UPI001F16D9E8|nr:erythromycin esterase family protein [Dyadobacter sp. CY261]MCF0069465.1 erythromycin esterase family protein [Dyadobacter sp. CY261]
MKFLTWFCILNSSLFWFSPVNWAAAQSARWVRQLEANAVALDSANLTGEANVSAIRQRIGHNYQVLGIGEQSHGTSEFFTARILLIKALASDPSLKKIGLEAPMAEVDGLNDYIRTGAGDLKSVLRSFRLYGYECQEFVELVEEVRRIGNVDKRKLQFFGFDMQSPFQSLRNIADSGMPSDAADSLKKLLHDYELLSNDIYNHSFNEGDFAELTALSNHVMGKVQLKNEQVKKSIRSYRQFLLLNNPKHAHARDVQSEIRDSLMAENVLAEVKPGEKIILLAHNAHLQKTPNIFSKSVGYYLSRKLQTGYQCIGMTTSAGFYTTFTPAAGRITSTNPVVAGDSTAFEYHFAKLNKPVYWFKTSELKAGSQNIQFPHRYRLLVYGLADNQFFEGNVLNDFDYVLHIRQTTGNHSFYLK